MTTRWPPGRWFIEYGSADDLCAYRCTQVLAEGQTRYQRYAFITSPLLGKALILDGVLQSATRDEAIYHEALVHPALCVHRQPREVAVLGGGEGATIREVLRHSPVQRLVMVDLDAELVQLCQQYLPEFADGAWDDPRLELVHQDGRAWLAQQPDAALDVVILDITDPLEGGPAFFLFTQEMFRLVQAKLRPDGVMSIQAGSAGQAIRLLPHLGRTLETVFLRVIPYTAFIPSFNDMYGFILAGGQDCSWPPEGRLRQIQRERGLSGLMWFAPEAAASAPALPPYLRRLLQQEGQVLTDAAPFQQPQPFPII